MKFKIRSLLVPLLFIEILSFLGYLNPVVNTIGFLVFLHVVVILAIKDLRWGLLAVATELVIGSKGYLFHFDLFGFTLSLRIGLWLAVMGIWATRFLIDLARNGKGALQPYRSPLLYGFSALFLLSLYGALNGLAGGNALANVFFDFNAWLFLLLAFPVFSVRDRLDKDLIRLAGAVLTAAVAWLCAKTLFLLYFFSHGFPDLAWPVYRWVRESGVGEITRFGNGFYRVFFQSHIYLIPALLVFLHRLTATSFRAENRAFWRYFGLLALVLAVNIIGLSRSNWVGLGLGLGAYFVWRFAPFFTGLLRPSARLRTGLRARNDISIGSLRGGFRAMALFAAAVLASLAIITVIMVFPWPSSTGGANAFSMIRERASDTDEAALTSRWDLLDALWPAVRQDWLLGRGFGAEISYRSSDPRALEAANGGLYSTYAFEWGWLDMWLKLGISGPLLYLALLGYVFWMLMRFDKPYRVCQTLNASYRVCQTLNASCRVSDTLNVPLAIGLLAIAAVHAFSPYLNHPLGIGYLLLCTVVVFISNEKV